MAEKIKLTFLGTGDAVPTAKRNHTAIYLQYKDENILIDCGEGTQRQFRKAGLNPLKLSRILITHWHGDHILGIPGILQTFALSEYNKKLYIHGPKYTEDYIGRILDAFKFVADHNLAVKDVSGRFFENDDFYLECEKMNHGTFCNAYNFVVKEQRRIDKGKLEKTSIPAGPLLQKLKNGEDVVHEGKKYSSKNLTYVEEGKKISFVLDTKMNDKIVPFVKDADLLVCESTFGSELQEQAEEYRHLTSKDAGEIAKKAKVKQLYLTHISGRYENNMEKIENEAKEIFENSKVVKDLESFEL